MSLSGSAAATALSQIQRIEHETLSQRVYRDLRQLLVEGQVQPGERLTLRGLASALGTSPMPVREAIRQLVAEQALELLPNRSIRVPVMTKARFRELRQIRLSLEGLAVETAARCIDAAAVERLETVHRAFAVLMADPDPDVAALIRANKQFHFTAYAAAQMPTLLSMIEGLWLQIGPVINLDLGLKSRRLNESNAALYHRRIIDALRARDPQGARAALCEDISSTADFILAQSTLPD